MSSESKQDFGVPFFAGVNSPRLFAGVERTALGWVIAPAAGFGMGAASCGSARSDFLAGQPP